MIARAVVLVACLTGSAYADPRFAGLAPAPSGDDSMYLDTSMTTGSVGTSSVDAQFVIFDLGGEAAIARVGDASVRVVADLPLLIGSAGPSCDGDDVGNGIGFGNPALGGALSGRGLGGDWRVTLTASPLSSHGDLAGVDNFAGSTAESHAVGAWLQGSRRVGVAARGTARLTLDLGGRGFVAVEPGVEVVARSALHDAVIPELSVAAGVRWGRVTLFTEGAIAHHPQIGTEDGYWPASLAVALRIAAFRGVGVTPWIATPLIGDPTDWDWFAFGLSIDLAWPNVWLSP